MLSHVGLPCIGLHHTLCKFWPNRTPSLYGLQVPVRPYPGCTRLYAWELRQLQLQGALCRNSRAQLVPLEPALFGCTLDRKVPLRPKPPSNPSALARGPSPFLGILERFIWKVPLRPYRTCLVSSALVCGPAPFLGNGRVSHLEKLKRTKVIHLSPLRLGLLSW